MQLRPSHFSLFQVLAENSPLYFFTRLRRRRRRRRELHKSCIEYSTMQEILYSMNDSKSIIKCTLKKCVYTKTALCCCKVFQEMQNTLVYLICQLPRQIIIRRKKSVKIFFFVQQKWLQNYCYVCIVSVFMTFYRKKCKQ